MKSIPSNDVWLRDQRLLDTIHGELPALTMLLEDMDDALEAGVYRYYHNSVKIFDYQEYTGRALEIFRRIGEQVARPLNPLFMDIVVEGTGRTFTMSTNDVWGHETRPIVEALLHARYFVAMMVNYGSLERAPFPMLPYGWAAVLELYGMR